MRKTRSVRAAAKDAKMCIRDASVGMSPLLLEDLQAARSLLNVQWNFVYGAKQ